jgi:hypothetical protein
MKRHASLRLGWGREALAVKDATLQLRNGDPVAGLALKYFTKNVVELVR